jgi:hypothetical protein
VATNIHLDIFEKHDGDDSHVNRVGVNHFRNPVKSPPFYISIKIMDMIAHCCLIDGRSGPSVTPNIFYGRTSTLL